MDVEILAIGDPVQVKKLASEFPFVQENDVFLLSVPANLAKYAISCFASQGIKAMLLSQFHAILKYRHKHATLPPVDTATAYGWLRTGNDFFAVTHNSCFEVFSIDKKLVQNVHTIDSVTVGKISSTGLVYGFAHGTTVTFYIGDNLDLLFDVKISDQIEDIVFAETDRVCAVVSAGCVFVYDVFKGLLLGTFQRQPFVFIGESVYLSESDTLLSDYSVIEAVGNMKIQTNSKIEYKDGKTAKFEDGEIQWIVYEADGMEVCKKTQSHIKIVRFCFSDTKLFAYLVKNPGHRDHYVIESYSSTGITSLPLNLPVMELAASDDFFVLQLSDYDVQFFSNATNQFRMINSVKKDGPVLLSCWKSVACLYDTATGNIEFYDGADLRIQHPHPGCVGIEWAPNGLYVAAFAANVPTGCHLQIFDCNGVLVYKSILVGLTSFAWRGTSVVSEKEVKEIVEQQGLDGVQEQEDESLVDIHVLAAEWKAYILSKADAAVC